MEKLKMQFFFCKTAQNLSHYDDKVSANDIEKVSRHCPALKVLHLFFVNFQVGKLLIICHPLNPWITSISLTDPPFQKCVTTSSFGSKINFEPPYSLSQGDDASDRAREKLFPNLEGKCVIASMQNFQQWLCCFSNIVL